MLKREAKLQSLVYDNLPSEGAGKRCSDCGERQDNLATCCSAYLAGNAEETGKRIWPPAVVHTWPLLSVSFLLFIVGFVSIRLSSEAMLPKYLYFKYI